MSRPIICVSVKKTQTLRVFFYICLIFVSFNFILINFTDDFRRRNGYNQKIVREAIENVGKDYRYAEIYRKLNRLPAGFKYILLWTPQNNSPLNQFETGQLAFLKHNCSVRNCVVITDKNFFANANSPSSVDEDTSKFDAIAFNGRNILDYKKKDLPQRRSPHQRYIFFNMESFDNQPICNPLFDDFFNWTATYKLNSDFLYRYFCITNKHSAIIGPQQVMKWDNVSDTYEVNFHEGKTKAVAWFVSNCFTRSGRSLYTHKLSVALNSSSLSVDIYGDCGPYKCARNSQTDCDAMLKKDYFFYLAMENSFAEDYVTEKLLTALQNDMVPIVYGGANYSRFLPPGSYIDARQHTPTALAGLIARTIESREDYNQYFRWRQLYTYHKVDDEISERNNVCSLCAALHNDSLPIKTYKDFRSWWNPDYLNRCKEIRKIKEEKWWWYIKRFTGSTEPMKSDRGGSTLSEDSYW